MSLAHESGAVGGVVRGGRREVVEAVLVAVKKLLEVGWRVFVFVVYWEPCTFDGAQYGGKVGRSFVGVGIDDGGSRSELFDLNSLVEVPVVGVVGRVEVVGGKLGGVTSSGGGKFVGTNFSLGDGCVELGGGEGGGSSVSREGGVKAEGKGVGGEVGKASEGTSAVGKFGRMQDALSEVGIVVVKGYGDVEAGVLVSVARRGGPSDDALPEVL